MQWLGAEWWQAITLNNDDPVLSMLSPGDEFMVMHWHFCKYVCQHRNGMETMSVTDSGEFTGTHFRADSRLTPSQWETLLQS